MTGLCEEVESCVVGETFADRASCVHFWECKESSGVVERLSCGAVRPMYVYDLQQRACVEANAAFDCQLRCPLN